MKIEFKCSGGKTNCRKNKKILYVPCIDFHFDTGEVIEWMLSDSDKWNVTEDAAEDRAIKDATAVKAACKNGMNIPSINSIMFGMGYMYDA